MQPSSVILGKVQASAVGVHRFSLSRAVDDSLPARILGGRMSQTGRVEPLADATVVHRLVATRVDDRDRQLWDALL
jgi:hypothetical protein